MFIHFVVFHFGKLYLTFTLEFPLRFRGRKVHNGILDETRNVKEY